MKYLLFFTFFIKVTYCVFYKRIINTPIFSNNLLNYHHVVLLQKKPFINNQTEYNDIYAIDFCPCGNLFEILLGKKIKGKIRLFYIDKCSTSHIFEFIKSSKNHRVIDSILESADLTDLANLANIDNNIYNKIINWDLTFQLYTRNCQNFARYIFATA
jgi:hypothetical protein